jgi:hypothetical protein
MRASFKFLIGEFIQRIVARCNFTAKVLIGEFIQRIVALCKHLIPTRNESYPAIITCDVTRNDVMLSMRNCQVRIFKIDTRTMAAMAISKLSIGLMFNPYMSILFSIYPRV